MSTIRIRQTKYAAKHRGRFAPSFEELIETEDLGGYLTDRYLIVGGYVFEMKVSEPPAHKPGFYSISADPIEAPGASAHFYFDSNLRTVRTTDENRPARADDPSI
jgi:hypothetical protein